MYRTDYAIEGDQSSKGLLKLYHESTTADEVCGQKLLSFSRSMREHHVADWNEDRKLSGCPSPLLTSGKKLPYKR